MNINECKIKIWKQASDCSLEEWEKDEEVQISTEYNEISNFVTLYFAQLYVLLFYPFLHLPKKTLTMLSG